jgi:hypothetical protein
MEDVIDRFAKDHSVSVEFAELLAHELKRFLVLSVLFSTHNYEMAGPADGLWHTFLIFTKEYHDFCRRLGVPYIHHVPKTKRNKGNSSGAGYQRFLEDYQLVFRQEPTSAVWPQMFLKGYRVLRAEDLEHARAGAGNSNCP